MDISKILINSILQVWYIIPLLILVLTLKSRWFKGVLGEYIVNKLLAGLPETDYKLIKNVTLPTEDGPRKLITSWFHGLVSL